MNYRQLLFELTRKKVVDNINFSFSQEGEDLIIDELLDSKKEGFYVDFGAYDPIRFSNTLRFYQRGWHGLNVDATPGSMRAFNRLRKKDINVECGLSNKPGELFYYQFFEPALNTFDKSIAEAAIKHGYKLKDKSIVKTFSPMEILDNFVPEGTQIDFMDIDIEGMDEQIIGSIDWKKYRPTVVATEKEIDDRNSALYENSILKNEGYKLIACTTRSAIYMLGEYSS